VRTLDEEVGRLVAGPRFSASALAVFAAVGLLLAGIGVYGVIAYSAGQRTREIGVRVALGATRRQVLWLVVRQGLSILAAGLAGGMIVAVWVAQALAGLLHDVQPADPAAYAAVSVLLSVVALAAIFLPAYRATRVNAVVALRAD
jgi:ABC-type antimicrobial peptide transport system permease subunit